MGYSNQMPMQADSTMAMNQMNGMQVMPQYDYNAYDYMNPMYAMGPTYANGAPVGGMDVVSPTTGELDASWNNLIAQYGA